MLLQINSDAAMRELGARIGDLISGNEVIELIGDVGAGKTTLVKGLAAGLGINEDVQSPTFTISRVYDARDNIKLAHYDFYRLNEPGIMTMEIAESMSDPKTVVVIEWGDIIGEVLPEDRLTIQIQSPSEDTREVEIVSGGPTSQLIESNLS